MVNWNKISLMVTTFVLLCLQISCKSLPQNNWTEEDKGKIAGAVYFTLQMSGVQSLYNDKEKIAQEVIYKCITKYPDIEEFKKHTDYSAVAMKEIFKEDYNIDTNNDNSVGHGDESIHSKKIATNQQNTGEMDTVRKLSANSDISNDESVTNSDSLSNYSDNIDSVNATTVKYKVITGKAFFFDSPDSIQGTRRRAYLVQGENIVALDQTVDFIYCIFQNPETKKRSKGWILKSCLAEVN